MTSRRPSRSPRFSRRITLSAAIEPRSKALSGYTLPTPEIEKALIAGTHVAALESYFGEEAYGDLRALAQQVVSRPGRGGPRVFILPTYAGTKLGRLSEKTAAAEEILWIDPCDLVAGNLARLGLREGKSEFGAFGPIELYYLKLKLRLRAAGLDAELWGYDWRLSIEDTANRLIGDLAKVPAKEVHLVAHGLGGLVARAALKKAGTKVKRLVTLGMPNHGSYLAVQIIRGTFLSFRKLAALDPRHSAETLSAEVFNTFSSTYELLPDSDLNSTIDLFNAAHWPKGTPLIDQKLLDQAKRVPSLLAPADERLALIAGVNQKTITSLDLIGSDFVYTESLSGDGAVPLTSAQLSGAPIWYIEEEHGSLPGNGVVARAVSEILTTGDTRQLVKEWRDERASGPVRKVTDPELRDAVSDSKYCGEMSAREFRALLAPLLSSDPKDTPPVPSTAIAMSAPFAAVRPLELNQIIVGRRRQKRLEICIAEGDITEVNARAIVLGLFRQVSPGGPALAIDERLGGAVCEFVNRRMFSGNLGELFILPTGRHPVQADLVLFAGLGSFDHFNFEALQLVAENTIRTLIRTNVEDFATVLLGSGTGMEMVDSLRHLLEGFIKGIRDSATGNGVRRVTFCIRDPDKCGEVANELFRLAGTELFNDIEVSFETKILPATLVRDVRPRADASNAGVEPAYLIIRQEGVSKNELLFRSSLLTTGVKAAVITGQRIVSTKTLAEQLEGLSTGLVSPNEIGRLGQTLAAELLAEEVLAVLPTVVSHPLVIVHDAEAARIPWEVMQVGGRTPVLEAGITRRYLADNLSVAKWLEARRQNPKLKILLVVNPSRGEDGSLPGAEDEGRRVEKLFAADAAIELTVRAGAEATRATLMQDFRSGAYDLVHYAGHASFDVQEPARSGILCHGKEVLSGTDLAGLGNLPNLVVFNACESGRIRSPGSREKTPSVVRQMEKTTGMAEAFLRGGVSNYIGTYWPVGDVSAATFATVFYPALLRGETVGAALLAARLAIKTKDGTTDWADYIHYGNQNFVLKKNRESAALAQ